MSTVHEPRERWVRDVRVRLKTALGDADPTWTLSQLDPDSVEFTVGGTTSAGDYVITIEPEDGSDSIPITFTRVAETDAQIAAGLAVLAPTTAPSFIRSASSDGAVLRLSVLPGAKPFRFTTTDPGTATLTLEFDEIYPITRQCFFQRPDSFGHASAVFVTFVAVDDDGIPLEDDNACTFDFTALRIVERWLDSDHPSSWGNRPPAIARSEEVTGASLGVEYRVPFNGGRIGFELSALTDEPTGATGVEIWLREGVQ